eukprot:Skav212589  [mRNA]  locus=scaffold125:524976:529826:+ [translate_table: standard]
MDTFLEPKLEGISELRCSLQVRIIATGQEKSMGKTTIHHQQVFTDFCISTPNMICNMMNVMVRLHNGVLLISKDDQSSIVPCKPKQISPPLKTVEVCAGIGATSHGLSYCDTSTACFCDMNGKFCEWLKHNTGSPVIEGDITQAATQAIVIGQAQEASVLTSGVSCQPFSSLGDGRQHADERSTSFVASLQIAHYLRPVWVILECTKEVMTSEWAQNLLNSFVGQTGYRISQRILDLHKTWPGKRTRWWALLTHPDVPHGEIPPLPELPWLPSMLHVIPRMLKEPLNEIHALQLDGDELMGFSSTRKGIQSYCIDMFHAMPTATHSWGSQLRGCECGCRQEGFRPSRLEERGLYGVLVPTGIDHETIFGTVQCIRHMHAREVALLSGLDPLYIAEAPDRNARLDLAGTGQQASPIQSSWVLANALKALHGTGILEHEVTPNRILGNVITDLLKGRDQVWKIQTKTRLMYIFEHAISMLLDIPRDPEASLDHRLIEHFAETTADHDTPEVEHPSNHEAAEVPGPSEVEVTGGDAMPDGASPCVPGPTPSLHAMPSVVSPTDHGPTRGIKREGREEGCISPYSCTGGVEGFAVTMPKRIKPTCAPTATWTQVIEHARAPSHAVPSEAPVFSEHHSDHGSEAEESEHSAHSNRSEAAEETDRVEPDSGALTPEPERHLPPPTETHPPDEIRANQTDREITNMIQVSVHREEFQLIRTTTTATVQDLKNAEARLLTEEHLKPIDAMGQMISPGDPLRDRQRIAFVAAGYEQPEPPTLVTCNTAERIRILWDQQGWVANDEMDFYLYTLFQTKVAVTTPSMYVCNKDHFCQVLDVWIDDCIQNFSDPDASVQVFTAFLYQGHWIPMGIELDGTQVSFLTTSPGRDLSMAYEDIRTGNIPLQTLHIGQSFANDCGFQTIAWIQQVAAGNYHFQGYDVAGACTLRDAYEYWVRLQASTYVFHCRFGGAPDTKLIGSLQQLLEEHGVADTRSKSCAEMLVTNLGAQTVANTLASPQPWRDLKAKASQQNPPIQIVMSDELQAAVAKRLKEGKQWGSKQNKSTHKPGKKDKPVIRLSPDQLSIPKDIFAQTDGTKVNQVPLKSIGKNARGIALATVDEAKAYLQHGSNLSREGLALIVIDHDDSRMPSDVELVKFPAHYAKTDEPILLTGAIIQLGDQKIQRAYPSDMTSIAEIKPQSIRVLAYRDQIPHDWNMFITKPVRMVMMHEAFQGELATEVLDLWDRQWLDMTFKKTSPQEAAIFAFLIRVPEDQALKALDASGTQGLFTEPRDASGRQPSGDFRVIWLPKKGLHEATIATQTSSNKAWIVRSGTRYGLRVAAAHAQITHKEQRPDVEFVDGVKQQYRLGPLPWGTTKSSLQSVLKQWGWQAIAVQPQGQVAGSNGLFWSCSAASPPSHWVFTMAHGDVLITCKENKAQEDIPRKAVVASGKTWKALHAKPAAPASSTTDPWVEKDPWASYQPTEPKPIASAQLAHLEAKLMEKVAKTVSATSSDDAAMDSVTEHRLQKLEEQIQQIADNTQIQDDSRVERLEDQVRQLTDSMQQLGGNVAQFQQNQNQQNQQVGSQINAIRTQVDTQHRQLQTMIDTKFTDQMDQIDRLLAKRLKTTE